MSGVRWGEPAARWTLAATVLGSGVAFLDATAVNTALPAIGADLGADLAGLQWTVNAYTLTLASLILLGGSLGDRCGRRRVFVVGTVWFALASLLCGLAPDVGVLVAARALQGVGGALLTPGSLAILQAVFAPEDRARAIGAWSGLSGVATALGPFLGGWLVQAASWRWIFLVDLPLAALVLVAARHVPETRDPLAAPGLDVPGVVLGTAGLGALTWALVAWPERGADGAVVAGLALGVAALGAFVGVQARSRAPTVPLEVFADRRSTGANLATLAVYAALGGVFFLLVLALQVVGGFSPLAAGAALLPVPVLLLLLSERAGALAQRTGPRLPMTLGPLVAAAGVAWAAGIGPASSYWLDVLPPVAVLGLGLALTVAPLTATVLAAVEDRHAGVASGVNNAVARAAGLLAVAALPLVVGLDGDEHTDPAVLQPAFRTAMLVCAGLLVAGAAVSAVALRPAPARTAPARTAPARPVEDGTGEDGTGSARMTP
ncbi:MFS transporter [Quadrisphaera sp. DSM 44207]|uniref:MFS transporter n=1 Tax=Quadrisphaera sp. DSM 44207 TaxID=1881057 RepID=UPI00088DECC3|nr:MFS transporter [Quadrisphaera sp. DSM 44207]SDQ63599.1 drug resistance transporter, EmrB/QacA subfamily [Quadrisphaera sp. DSM 44207]